MSQQCGKFPVKNFTVNAVSGLDFYVYKKCTVPVENKNSNRGGLSSPHFFYEIPEFERQNSLALVQNPDIWSAVGFQENCSYGFALGSLIRFAQT